MDFVHALYRVHAIFAGSLHSYQRLPASGVRTIGCRVNGLR